MSASSAVTVTVDPADEFVQPTLDEFEQSLHLPPNHPPITPEKSPQVNNITHAHAHVRGGVMQQLRRNTDVATGGVRSTVCSAMSPARSQSPPLSQPAADQAHRS